MTDKKPFATIDEYISTFPADIQVILQELARYKRAKGSIQFPLDKPIPYDLVGQIVTPLIKETPEK